MNARATAARIVWAVMEQGRSLSQALPPPLASLASSQRALAQELVYGTLRSGPRLEAYLARLLKKPLKHKDRDLYCLLMTGLYQLTALRIPAHAAVSDTVGAARVLDKSWATGLVNGVLRGFQRRITELERETADDETARWMHPQWWIDVLRTGRPGHWQTILTAGNQRPPMTLRVNLARLSRDEYLSLLQEQGLAAQAVPHVPAALTLARPVDVARLPGFADGWVSVQDAAAQLSASLLQLAPGMRLLDACAAPGGKTCHALESEPDLAAVVAVDLPGERLERLRDNLHRSGLQATVMAGDATEPASWWDGRTFDRILLDAPCSGSGVIRRHPDIKYLRRPQDIAALVAGQGRLLQALWPLLAPGGMLVYVTCSVLPEENEGQIRDFLARHGDAHALPVNLPAGLAVSPGCLLPPGCGGMDGFYYACLRKH
ncbi:MAG TPA: 16S rRNA (cytosine(967)-C(5))-methyltransferase RsmB [Gammaproteobacteria bacterium]|nr:16S rRNA (cytosine(967)-C(5))-methyltransferase RsmB [Gammaproteobacteria bacterium]